MCVCVQYAHTIIASSFLISCLLMQKCRVALFFLHLHVPSLSCTCDTFLICVQPFRKCRLCKFCAVCLCYSYVVIYVIQCVICGLGKHIIISLASKLLSLLLVSMNLSAEKSLNHIINQNLFNIFSISISQS